ncbi:MAG: hypothetical protein GTO24_02345 [candidate division Zixibacteria bacterium]|nr:hypothetical protein [candidate division Zixibacteria bacterium]
MSKTHEHTKNDVIGKKQARKPSLTAWICLGLTFAVVVAIDLIFLLPHGQAEPPRISLSETFWDFGRTPQHSRVSHTFWIRNVGGDTLRIIRVKSG